MEIIYLRFSGNKARAGAPTPLTMHDVKAANIPEVTIRNRYKGLKESSGL